MRIQVMCVLKASSGARIAMQADNDGQGADGTFGYVHEVLALDTFVLESMSLHWIIGLRTGHDRRQKQNDTRNSRQRARY
jgi:hypothetical protein